MRPRAPSAGCGCRRRALGRNRGTARRAAVVPGARRPCSSGTSQTSAASLTPTSRRSRGPRSLRSPSLGTGRAAAARATPRATTSAAWCSAHALSRVPPAARPRPCRPLPPRTSQATRTTPNRPGPRALTAPFGAWSYRAALLWSGGAVAEWRCTIPTFCVAGCPLRLSPWVRSHLCLLAGVGCHRRRAVLQQRGVVLRHHSPGLSGQEVSWGASACGSGPAFLHHPPAVQVLAGLVRAELWSASDFVSIPMASPPELELQAAFAGWKDTPPKCCPLVTTLVSLPCSCPGPVPPLPPTCQALAPQRRWRDFSIAHVP